jgi:hypothetical protein
MSEYKLSFDHSIRAGRVVFRIVNKGRFVHSLIMFPEDEDAPPLNVQLHGNTRRAVQILAEQYPRNPGESGGFAVDLVAGRRYGLMSPYVGDGGVVDFLKGMNAEFRALPG